MKMLRLVWPAVLAAAAFGQTSGALPEFEVASIKPSPPLSAAGQANIGLHIDGAQVRCAWLSLKDYIGMAYDVKNYQISGPAWLASEHFDIAAKVPSGGRDQIREMLQSLLSDRFQMKMHREKKDYPVYILTQGKGGLKLKESGEQPDADAQNREPPGANVSVSGGPGGVSLNLGKGSSFNFANNQLEARKLTMQSFADLLGRFVDRPVIDQTELKPAYDFTMEFTAEDYRGMLIRSALAAGIQLPPEALRALEMSSGDSLLSAVEKLGLKLEPRKAPIDVLIIDRIERSPTEN